MKRSLPGSLRRIELALLAFAICACGHSSPGPTLVLTTLSNRADLISGGDAFLEIVVPQGISAAGLKVDVGGTDVSSAFAVRASGRLLGVVTGLANGANVVTARLNGTSGGRLTITNHPIGGPVITGPQAVPFVCATPTAQPATATTPASNASGLPTSAVDAQCNIATKTFLYYRTTATGCTFSLPDPNPPATPPANGCFKPYDPGAAAPADLASTTTDKGVTVPYIVRVERGTINRGIYDIAVLFDPTKDDPAAGWMPFAPQAGWNGKVVYTFGASTGQPRRQFRSEQSWVDDAALSRGFMVVDNSMTDSLYDSNRYNETETLMMMKEHIIDTYGEIRYTIGNGCSGGSIGQITAASIYPGLIDGIQPTCTYPDSETTGMEVGDCVLLVNYFNKPEFAAVSSGLTQDQINAKKGAIAGHIDQTGCHGWYNLFGTSSKAGTFFPIRVTNSATGVTTQSATATNNCQLPASQVYDPGSNPTGVRCSAWDYAASIWGTVPGTNRARDTRDTVGIQYGLKALVSGAITPEEFVTLNEKVGGFDGDGNPSNARTTADPDALTTAYAAGLVSGGQLSKTAIIDLRGFDDQTATLGAAPQFGIHHTWRSFAVLDRLDKANGNHDNYVMWRYGKSPSFLAPAASKLTLQSFLTMDQWLASVEADKSGLASDKKLAANKPAAAFTFCYLSSDTTFATKVTDPAACAADQYLAPHTSPRQVAGGPLAEDILKCQLKPLDAAAYLPAVLSPAQLDRMRAVFPDGVCDWSKKGVNQAAFAGPFTFEAGPGGKPLGDAPVSTKP